MERCIVCGGIEFRKIYSDTLKVCTGCGFATANMEIGPEMLLKTYSVHYFMGEEYLNYLQDKEILQLNFQKRIRTIKRKVAESLPVAHVLEIGCAYGFFGELVRKNWPAATYKGIDVVPEAVQYGRETLKLDLAAGNYLDMKSPAQPYTDVFLWDVIEHLQFPEKFLARISQETAAGGRIYITTGDFSSFLSWWQGQRWRMIHPPSHIHYFSRVTLIRLLSAYGFRTVSARYIPVYRSLRQIYYSLFLLGKTAGISRKLFSLIPSRWRIPLNTFDIFLLVATKDKDIPQ
jgi:2-polyprenyl-3-methyl-5-hydroxy-6-metoxy-1,4-benzoquinol methylase